MSTNTAGIPTLVDTTPQPTLTRPQVGTVDDVIDAEPGFITINDLPVPSYRGRTLGRISNQ